MSMPNLGYLLPRLARHLLPAGLTRFLLLRSIVIKAGLETAEPQAAVDRYLAVLNRMGTSIQGKRVLLFGYGGRFDVGVGLLDAGAGHVVLCEESTPPDDAHNARLLPKHANYLILEDGLPRPRAECMTLLQADIREVHSSSSKLLCDFVLSSSVYEHLDDVDGITRALTSLTRPGGVHIHYVDLRDHFFKYPFEMLTFSDKTWRGWLNPSSNLNRFRLWNYRQVFEKYFSQVGIEILERDEAAFLRIRNRIRPEFLSGDPQNDDVTLILVTASGPRPL